MKQALIVIGLLTISIFGFAQPCEKNFIDQNFIEVTGKAELAIVPDLIYLKIILSDKDNKNKQSLDEIDKAMVNKLSKIGVDVSKDLSVKDFASDFKRYWLSNDEIILTKQYQLIVHDAKTLQQVYTEFQKLGISHISIEKLDHSKIEQYRKEVKVNAVKAAKEKAEGLASAVNQSIGRALYIQEVDLFNPYLTSNSLQNRDQNSLLKLTDNIIDSEEPAIEFEKINLEYAILVRFELK
ncbi:MAG: SIMPL domain-containing protein [Bacteroidetes bacterium HGW-Bacteroidetes-22]|nr:MAG: SIMPL domain-containing protein [Bacteroidetes bacterium HGW-Bacteroidetes-22]